MTCKYCSSICVKYGFQSNGSQRFKCKSCKKHQQETYSYQACTRYIWDLFPKFSDLGAGLLKMSRFLGISINTLQKWVSKAKCLGLDLKFKPNGIYDIDEIQTFIGKRSNKLWVCYGWNIKERKAIGLHVGNRSSQALSAVTQAVLEMRPLKINTDNWPGYTGLIPKDKHKAGKRKANHIERQHVNLRKDITCLIRDTICFSKNREMLEARIRWYLWGNTDPYFFLKK